MYVRRNGLSMLITNYLNPTTLGIDLYDFGCKKLAFSIANLQGIALYFT